MRCTTRPGLMLTALLAAAAAAAQPAPAAPEPPPPPPPPDEREILVERERLVDLRAAGAAAQIIAGMPRAREPLARFNVPLCFSLAIDNADRGRLIGRRIIANARAAGLRIAKPGCRPNALLIIGDDMRGMIEQRRRSGRRFFVRLKRHEINRAMRVSDPVFVFHQITVSGRDSRIGRGIRKDMIAAVALMERGPSERFTPEQVADYATLRLLAPTRETAALAAGTPRTIMTLFAAPDRAPPEMSRLDRAYLGALYRLMTNANAVEVLMSAARDLAGEQRRRRR